MILLFLKNVVEQIARAEHELESKEHGERAKAKAR